MTNIYWSFVVLAALNSAAGNFLLKLSQKNPDFLTGIFSPSFAGGCALYFINVLLFAYSLRELEVSKAYPALAGMSFVFLLVASILFLGETITARKIAGIILVVFAFYLLSS